MNFPSLLQKYCVTDRLVSLVMSLDAVHGSLTRFTQMLRVSLYGLRNEMYLPSGDIWAPEISGLPKNSSRSMSGGSLPFWAGAMAGVEKTMASASDQRSVWRPHKAVTEFFIGEIRTERAREG